MLVLSPSLQKLVSCMQPQGFTLSNESLINIARELLKHDSDFFVSIEGDVTIRWNYAASGENARWTPALKGPITVSWELNQIEGQYGVFRAQFTPTYVMRDPPGPQLCSQIGKALNTDISRHLKIPTEVVRLPNPPWALTMLGDIDFYLLADDSLLSEVKDYAFRLAGLVSLQK